MFISKLSTEENKNVIRLELTDVEFSTYFTHCDCCGDIIFRDEIVLEQDDNVYCKNCVTECHCCGNLHPTNDMYSVEDSDYLICDYCYRNETYVCSHCNRHFLYEDSLTYDDFYDANYCDDCSDEFNSSLIQEYHHMKNYEAIKFYGNEDRRNHCHIGFELEVDSNECINIIDSAESVVDIFDDFIRLEHDGSLHRGFENISNPATIDYLISRKDDFKNMFNNLTDYGLTSHDNGRCGMHCHIDREYLGRQGEASIARLLFIFERHWDNLLRFSRRSNYQVDQWAARYSTKTEDSITEISKKTKAYKGTYGRYYCVNLSNDNTVEIRLWRGTLNINTFIATLKFTERLAYIAKTCPASKLVKMTFEDILGDDKDILAYWETVKNRSIN